MRAYAARMGFAVAESREPRAGSREHAVNPQTVEIRVRYAETDRMGVVYHANYLVWCEIGRTDFIRERCGMS